MQKVKLSTSIYRALTAVMLIVIAVTVSYLIRNNSLSLDDFSVIQMAQLTAIYVILYGISEHFCPKKWIKIISAIFFIGICIMLYYNVSLLGYVVFVLCMSIYLTLVAKLTKL